VDALNSRSQVPRCAESSRAIAPGALAVKSIGSAASAPVVELRSNATSSDANAR